MSNYYLILVWIFFVAVLSAVTNVQRKEVVCGKTEYRFRPLWAFVIFVPLIIWTGFRGGVGDTGAYIRAFEDMPVSPGGISAYMETITKDKGFYFLSALIKTVINDRVHLYFVIIAFIQVYFLIRIYRKYSMNYVVSFFLFIVSTDYISWMFNGMRQFTAVAITLLAFDLAIEKKYIRAILVILFASLFHQSALLVLPFLFVCQGDAWNKKTLLFILAVIVAVAFIEEFTGLLDTVLAETQYENVVSDWQSFEDDGTNILRVLVYAVPTILSLIGIRYIRKANDPVINMCVNMSIVSTGLYVMSMFTSGIFIGRLPIYFSLYNYILLPWEVESMFTRASAKILYLLMIVGYVGFYFMHIKFVWGLV